MNKLVKLSALAAVVCGAQSLLADTYQYNVALRDQYGLLLGHDNYTTWYVQVYDETTKSLVHNSDYYYEVKASSDWSGHNLQFKVFIGYPDPWKVGDQLSLRVFENSWSGGKSLVDTITGVLPPVGAYDGKAVIPVSFSENAVKELSNTSSYYAYWTWLAGMSEQFDDKWTADDADADNDGVSNADECLAGTDPYGGAMLELSTKTSAGDVEQFARADKLNCALDASGGVVSAAFDWSSGHVYTLRWKQTLADLGEDLPLCDAGGVSSGTKYFVTRVSNYEYPTGSTMLYAAKPGDAKGDYYVGLAVDGNFCKYVKVTAAPVEPDGSEENPWPVGAGADEVFAHTNGVGALVFTGSGKMADFASAASAPWAAVAAEISSVRIPGSVSLGLNALAALDDSTLVDAAPLSVAALKNALPSAQGGGQIAPGDLTIDVKDGVASLGVSVLKADSLEATADWAAATNLVVDVPAGGGCGFYKLVVKPADVK